MTTQVEKLTDIENELSGQGDNIQDVENGINTINSNLTGGSQKSQIVDSSGNTITIDEHTMAITNIMHEHHEIHEGNHYFICGFETLASDALADFVVQTPDTTTAVHMVFGVHSTSRLEFYLYESVDAGSDGSAVTPFNNNRNSTNTSSLVVSKNPTINSLGTLLYSQSKGLAGATPAGADSAGIVDRLKEILLKRNTKYLFRIKSKDNGNIVSYCGEWYENGV